LLLLGWVGGLLLLRVGAIGGGRGLLLLLVLLLLLGRVAASVRWLLLLLGRCLLAVVALLLLVVLVGVGVHCCLRRDGVCGVGVVMMTGGRMRGFKYEDKGHTVDGAVVYQYIQG